MELEEIGDSLAALQKTCSVPTPMPGSCNSPGGGGGYQTPLAFTGTVNNLKRQFFSLGKDGLDAYTLSLAGIPGVNTQIWSIEFYLSWETHILYKGPLRHNSTVLEAPTPSWSSLYQSTAILSSSQFPVSAFSGQVLAL